MAPAAESVIEEPPAADAELLNAYWKILSLAVEPVSVAPGKREPHVILRSSNGRDSWSATVGCNLMSGAHSLNVNRIEGSRLELLDDAGAQTLLCEAVHLE
jgi:hypothetical protein